MTKKDMRDLLVKFLEIKKLGWIKTMRKGTTGIGYTFETMLGKPEESFPIPDFRNIEIKVKRRYSRGNITLFNAIPDNEVFPIKRLYNEYGVCDKNKNNYKTFMITVNSQKLQKYGYHMFNLTVNYKKRCIIMNVYDLNNNLIENDISWSFELINEKIRNKIQNLAIVKADIKKENNEEYYQYYHISFYEIYSAERFIELIDAGIISITYKVSVHTTGNKTGEMDNHGVGFSINEKDIEKLYKLKDFEKKTTNSRS